ncbi:hypothetical protein KBI52_10675 [Microvirga sp. HBU67558]|nr:MULTISPECIES: CCE_0567 family metalloprotein [Microvirga]MBQ0820668.1 hypothetical protein [Microvirga sp. HBU67558]
MGRVLDQGDHARPEELQKKVHKRQWQTGAANMELYDSAENLLDSCTEIRAHPEKAFNCIAELGAARSDLGSLEGSR